MRCKYRWLCPLQSRGQQGRVELDENSKERVPFFSLFSDTEGRLSVYGMVYRPSKPLHQAYVATKFLVLVFSVITALRFLAIDVIAGEGRHEYSPAI